MMHSNSSPPTASSPFDPFLSDLLIAIRELESGFSPATNSKEIAERLDVEPAFVEMLATSARRRKLIEPFYSPANRNALRWKLSSRGEAFLATNNAHPIRD